MKKCLIRSTLVLFTLLFGAPALTFSATPGESAKQEAPAFRDLRITSKASRIHLGSRDSFDRTEGGTRAAKLVLQAIESNDAEAARKAVDLYAHLIPTENFGGEYTALQWICRYILSSDQERKVMAKTPYDAAFLSFFMDNNYANLKEYLNRKHKLEKFSDENTEQGKRRAGYLEDMILFSNPRRQTWEKSDKIIEVLHLKTGQAVADIGSGPGYYTFQFADLVGKEGHIYAIESNKLHADYVTDLAKKLDKPNIEVVSADHTGFELPNKVDMAFMCSLYHILYIGFSEASRELYVNKIKNCLKEDAPLVIVDNSFVESDTLPYHGPHIAKELIMAQLEHYGFRLMEVHEFIPQRFILVFKLNKTQGTEAVPAIGKDSCGPDCIPLRSKYSILKVPMEVEADITKAGREGAKLFREVLEKKDMHAAKEAVELYGRLIPTEKFGEEYSAFQWFCEYFLASEKDRKQMLQDKAVADYFDYLAKDDFAVLKEYLRVRYDLEDKAESGAAGEDPSVKSAQKADSPEKGKDQPGERTSTLTNDQIYQTRDFILFNNPRRESWEKTSKIIEALAIKKGDCIADVGSGPGYYTFKFADLVGDKGHVYAVDTTKEHLDYVSDFAKKHNIKNVEVIVSKLNNTYLPENSSDMVFMCSLYAGIYATSMEHVKDSLIDSIKKALKKDGLLVIVDNDIIEDPNIVPYHGPQIHKQLIISQLKFYGFKLVNEFQFIPQRYGLVFKKDQ